MGNMALTNKVVGIYKDRSVIDGLLNQLNNAGFDKNDISILAKEINTEENTVAGTTYHEVGATDQFGNIVNETVAETGTVTREMGNTIVGNDVNSDYDQTHKVSEKDPHAMVKGATAGGVLGVVAGIGMLLIPGIGPVLAAGPILAAMTAAAGGAAIGATAGTLIGLFNDEGIPNDRSEFYTNHFNNGDAVVIVHTDENNRNTAREILMKYNPNTVDTF